MTMAVTAAPDPTMRCRAALVSVRGWWPDNLASKRCKGRQPGNVRVIGGFERKCNSCGGT